MPSITSALVSEARRVTRLQSKINKLNRELRASREELRLAKRNLRKLAQSAEPDPFNQAPPLRGFGES